MRQIQIVVLLNNAYKLGYYPNIFGLNKIELFCTSVDKGIPDLLSVSASVLPALTVYNILLLSFYILSSSKAGQDFISYIFSQYNNGLKNEVEKDI